MSAFIANNSEYNISTENEISIIISHFNSQFIFDVIKDNINKRFEYTQLSMSNIPASFEQNFKQLMVQYPSDVQRIDATRIETYKEIIQILCNHCGFIYNEEAIQDYYSAAFYLYNFLVSNFTNNLVSFFVNFILKEKNSLYENLNLNNLKKNKDSTTIYSKRVYKNPKVAIINANLDYVIDNISVFDISFNDVLNTIYQDKSIVKYIEGIVVPMHDFFKQSYASLLQSNLRPILLTNIRLELQRQSISEDISITSVTK